MFEEYLKQPICGKLEMQTTEDIINAFGELSDERMRSAVGLWFRDPVNDILMMGPTLRSWFEVIDTGKSRTYYLFSYKKDVFAVEGDQKDDTDYKNEKAVKYSLNNTTLLLSDSMNRRKEFYQYVSREMLFQNIKCGVARNRFASDYTIDYVDINFADTILVTKTMLMDTRECLW